MLSLSSLLAYFQLKACLRHPMKEGLALPGKMLRLSGCCLRRMLRFGRPWKRCLCVVLCIKDEASYMEEWLEYYLAVGVEHFFIYDNGSTDNLKELLGPYIAQGLLTYRYWPGLRQQMQMYRDALKHCRDYRWALFVDTDEFVQVMDGRSLPDVLKDFEDAEQLVMMYCRSGSNGAKERCPGLVLERFTRREAGVELLGKSFVCPVAVIEHRVHFAYVPGRSVDEAGRPCLSFSPAEKSTEFLRVNHYASRSWEEYMNKRRRGDALNDAVVADYFELQDKNDVKDLSMLAYVPRIRQGMQARRGAAAEPGA